MGNYTIVASSNEIPKEGQLLKKLNYILEWKYGHPMCLNIFVGSKFLQTAQSIAFTRDQWEEGPGMENFKADVQPICAVSDFKTAFDNYSKFLKKIGELGLNNSSQTDPRGRKFPQVSRDSIAFLIKNRKKYLLTDFTDVAAMGNVRSVSDINKASMYYIKDCINWMKKMYPKIMVGDKRAVDILSAPDYDWWEDIGIPG